MASERRHPGCLQPRHAAANHHNLLGRRRRPDVTELGLASGSGVLDARDRLPLVDPIDAPLVRSHARADVVEPALTGLAREVGVGDQGARHPDHVDVPGGDDAVGVHGIDDSAGVEDRQAGCSLLDGGCERHEDGL